ncbi:MAG: hypothetical protein ACE5ER_03665, partial [Nitrospinaceae bacterium]
LLSAGFAEPEGTLPIERTKAGAALPTFKMGMERAKLKQACGNLFRTWGSTEPGIAKDQYVDVLADNHQALAEVNRLTNGLEFADNTSGNSPIKEDAA